MIGISSIPARQPNATIKPNKNSNCRINPRASDIVLEIPADIIPNRKADKLIFKYLFVITSKFK